MHYFKWPFWIRYVKEEWLITAIIPLIDTLIFYSACFLFHLYKADRVIRWISDRIMNIENPFRMSRLSTIHITCSTPLDANLSKVVKLRIWRTQKVDEQPSLSFATCVCPGSAIKTPYCFDKINVWVAEFFYGFRKSWF